ncbi:MAG: hypothetical protein ACI8RD_009516 [Bacillariaceae sp.]|jgi:hypothetical protein
MHNSTLCSTFRVVAIWAWSGRKGGILLLQHFFLLRLFNRIQAIRFLGPAHLFFTSKYTR